MDNRATQRVQVFGPDMYDADDLAVLCNRAQKCTHTYFDTRTYAPVIEVGDLTTGIIALVIMDSGYRKDWLDALGVADPDEQIVVKRGPHTWINGGHSRELLDAINRHPSSAA